MGNGHNNSTTTMFLAHRRRMRSSRSWNVVRLPTPRCFSVRCARTASASVKPSLAFAQLNAITQTHHW